MQVYRLRSINTITSKHKKIPHTTKENTMIKYMSLFLLIASSLLVKATASQPDCFLAKYAVYVVNNLPTNSPPLQIHCFSKDDDMGYHNLTQNAGYRFAFCEKPLSTMFACSFHWNGNNKGFHVYDARWQVNRCVRHGICYYAVKSDAFYFSDSYPPKNLKFLCDWNPNSKCLL